MPIPVTCSGCNRAMKVKDDFEGKKARCPFCQGIVVVPAAEKPPASFDFAPDPEPERDRPTRRRRDNRDDEEPRSRRRDERDDDDDEPRRRSRSRDDYDEDRPIRKKKKASSSSGVNGSILGGLAMMLIAVLWFFGGLAVGYIFFYPPILFIVGLIALIKGLAGGE